MRYIFSFFKLVRGLNLFFVFLTQYCLRLFVIKPILEIYNIEPALNEWQFFLLALATVLITAAGYVINDYFDVKIDNLNRPGKIIIDRAIHRRTALTMHMVFNVVAIGLATYLGWVVGIYKLGIIYFIAAGLLWFYTTSFKKMVLVGNLVVAFLTGLVVLVVPLYETTIYNMGYDFLRQGGRIIMITALGYTFFAFLVSLIREIVKDMEDVQGDMAFDCRTMPVVWGIRNSKIVTAVISLAMTGLLGFVQLKYLEGGNYFQIAYLFILVQLPVLYLIFKLMSADTKRDFHFLSNVLKFVMLMGILSMPAFYYSL